MLAATVAVTATLRVHAAGGALAGLIDAVIAHGPESRVPAHLSVVLGISQVDRETAVKQAVIRDGQTVHTFNVCVAKHDDVVLMNVDEQDHSTKAYLVSAAGVLRKAVSYRAGAAAVERSAAEARRDLASEIKFWTEAGHRQPGSK